MSRRLVCISATTGKLLATLTRLRDLGNTVVVVEHDEETIRTADYVIDLGLGAGEHGGNVIFQGVPAQLLSDGHGSLTGAYLRGERSIPDAGHAATLVEGRDRHPRCAREQPEEHRRVDSARHAHGRHRRERVRASPRSSTTSSIGRWPSRSIAPRPSRARTSASTASP